ncbi:MAG: phage holin family protein [bacterium]
MLILFKWLVVAWAANILILYLLSKIVRGISLENFGTAIYGGLILGLVNAIVWKTVTFLPPFFWLAQVMTLGASSIVVMAVIVWLTSFFVPGMKVRSFWAAVTGGIVLGILNAWVKFYLLIP